MSDEISAEANTTLSIVDGRVAMSADGDASVRLSSPDQTPPSAIETHATLQVSGDDFRVEVEFDGAELDSLADAVSHAQEERR